MAYPFTDEHEMIRMAARGFLQDWYDGGAGPERIYQSGKAYDSRAWAGFAGELGMAAIAIDEAYGGASLGDLGRVIVMEELGASLCSLPFLTTCGIVADLIDGIGTDEIKQDVLPKIAAGEMRAAYLDGHDAKDKRVYNTVYADCVDTIFLSRRAGDAIEVVSIPTEANGLIITPEKTMDPTRSFCAVDWSGVAPLDMTVIGKTTQIQLNEIVMRSFISLAAECVGGAQKCLDMTLEYAAQRVQFDRPIASFQAIKHRCADMFICIEAARSAVYAAALAAPDDKTEAALIAKAYAVDAYFKITGDAIQLHGGIGFTWEYPLHFFFKRARANRSMFGSAPRDYDRLATLIFEDVA